MFCTPPDFEPTFLVFIPGLCCTFVSPSPSTISFKSIEISTKAILSSETLHVSVQVPLADGSWGCSYGVACVMSASVHAPLNFSFKHL